MLDRLLESARAHAHGELRALDPDLEALARAAPAPVGELVRLLGTRQVRLPLGWRAIESRYAGPLADTWQMVIDDVGASDPRAGELAHAVQIGASAGGEVYFGLVWSERGVSVAEIDFEEGLLRWFDTSQAFFTHVAEKERAENGAVPEALQTILGLSPPEPTGPPPGVTLWTGTPPPHPFAEAFSHFGVSLQAFVAGPTPKGRSLLVQRFMSGNPYRPCLLVVREADGSTRPLEWPDTQDVSGVCVVPGAERALVCTGMLGPLLELELETGARTERHSKVRWSTGFLDENRYVVHEDGELRVYAHPDGAAPLASAPTAGFNLFVAHGRVHTLVQGALVVHALRAGALVEELSAPLPATLYFLNAAAVLGGRRLVGSVDTQGKVTWLDVGPAD